MKDASSRGRGEDFAIDQREEDRQIYCLEGRVTQK